MNAKKTEGHRIPPCARCPYKLGLVHTLVNPCPQCRENGYDSKRSITSHKKESRDLIRGPRRA